MSRILRSGSGFGGLRILASPFMRFDTNSKTTDLIMFNSRNLGALIVDEKPHVKSWDEPQFSIQNIAIEESYGFGVLNEGQAIAVAKNVRLRQNEMSTPARPILSVGSDGTGFEHPQGLVGATPVGVEVGRYDHAELSASPLARRCRVGIHCRIIRSRRRIRPVPARFYSISSLGSDDLGPWSRSWLPGWPEMPAEFVDPLPE
jgi:hypothetical protein